MFHIKQVLDPWRLGTLAEVVFTLLEWQWCQCVV